VAHLLASAPLSSGTSRRGHDGDAVVEEPVQEGHGGRVLGQEAAPVPERPMGADPERTAFVGRGDEAEQELAAHGVERREPELVDHDQVDPQEALDEPSDAVVGEAPVERLYQVRTLA